MSTRKHSKPRCQVIQAVMAIHGCDFEEAAAGLEAAVQVRLEREPRSICWDGPVHLEIWVTLASGQVRAARERRGNGRVLQLVHGGGLNSAMLKPEGEGSLAMRFRRRARFQLLEGGGGEA